MAGVGVLGCSDDVVTPAPGSGGTVTAGGSAGNGAVGGSAATAGGANGGSGGASAGVSGASGSQNNGGAAGSSVGSGGAVATAGVSGSGVVGGSSGASGASGGAGGAPPVTTTVCETAAEDETATLACPAGAVITSIDFASYGTSTGTCEDLAAGACHAAESERIVREACLGMSSCTVDADNATFGGDPCSMTLKTLGIRATCTDQGGAGGTSGAGGSAGSAGASGSGGSGGSTVGGPWNEGTELKAFPTAEGYGRYTKGGRGGRVIEVTNLNDSGPGSLRDAVMATGPRTVVFNVSGAIHLESKLELRQANRDLTVAGQTAPGKGIVVHRYKFGMLGGEETILRFIRLRVGTESGVTQDGMGITSSPGPVIYDHLSISWTIDEGFSSRGTIPSNFTLQRSLISECLNDADHEIQMNPHGYAASISGDIGSFHHNLLAHCAGRNWSLAGGLGKNPVEFWGRLDIRNNVVYNWDNRTTDGGAHEVNFVGNYYKPGPASRLFVALSADIENFPGTQSYYFDGNVMPGHFDESNQEDGRRINYRNRTEESVTWDVFVDEEFFPSYVTPQSATDAYEDVIGNVGANRPMLDDHDERVIRETRDGTYTYEGSRTGKPGLPDNEADVGGLEDYAEESRPADWDTDHDGMPNHWETLHGLNPSDAADGNATTLSQVGYTNLEMYLNELAGDFD